MKRSDPTESGPARPNPAAAPPHAEQPDPSAEPEKEAICFTAGVPAATFAAGVIHAYLTSNRAAPGVLAGVSMGALNAAAMQRCYLELEKARHKARSAGAWEVDAVAESSRWLWFRRYLEALTTRPLGVLWDGIPDQSDFFADRAAVTDPTAGLFPGERGGEYSDRHRNARRDLYLFVKLGHWLAGLSVPFSHIAETVVRKVRAEERYPEPRTVRRILYWLASARVLFQVVLHIAMSPKLFPEYKFRAPQEPRGGALVQGMIWVWDKIVRWLPVNHQPGLTWSLAWGAFRALLGEAWKKEKSAKAKYLVRPQGKNWKTTLKANWTLLDNLAQQFGSALTSNYLWELPFRPLFGWRVYGGSLLLVLILTLSLAVPLWNFALPRLLHFARSYDFIARRAPLDGLLGETQSLMEKNRTQVTVWLLKWAEQSGPIKQWPLLQGAVRETQAFLPGHRRLLFALYLLLPAYVLVRVYRGRRQVFKHILKKVELQRALVDDFHLRIALVRLFGKDGRSPRVGPEVSPSEPGRIPKLLIAAASLQIVEEKREGKTNPKDVTGQQVWARRDALLTDALRAALSIPGLLEPAEVKGKDVEQWVDQAKVEVPERLDLVDAAVIRQNPLPALFGFLKSEEGAERPAGQRPLAHQLFSDEKHPAVHVVYGVPIHGEEKQLRESMDIVEVGRQSLQLARRRDTQLEVQQTRTLSRLQRQINLITANAASGIRYPIFADEIAPEQEIRFANPLSPTREEILCQVAHGCRRTLERLFSEALANMASDPGGIDCQDLLAKLPEVQARFPRGQMMPPVVGLPEVCSRCTRKLRASRPGPSTPYDLAPTCQSFQTRRWKPLEKRFSVLTRLDGKPRIIFVASGGVFRGSFHAGMLGAMLATQIRPNLIVGASVGTLMGGTLASIMSAKSYGDALKVLGELVEVFLHVDEQVAFTKTLKTAARDLGLRGRVIELSISQLRRAVRRGGQADPGYAAVGAPPALSDAISTLFLTPHRATREIAAEFVAGHVTLATRAFLLQMQKETLGRLDIRYALIGASLLEPVARRLLHLESRANSPQPFPNIVFLGTTTNLATRRPFLLGFADVDSYDFVKAALASSAFPCVFEPRRESEVFPSLGRTDVLYSDGGMFDNLPFFPALFVLSETQKEICRTSRGVHDWYKALCDRHDKPDLIFAGSLDANPSRDETFEDLLQVCGRASSLQNNVKIQAFLRAADKVDRQIHQLLRLYKDQVLDFTSVINRFLTDTAFPESQPTAVSFRAASDELSRSALQLEKVPKELADEFQRAVEDLLGALQSARKVDAILVREFEAATRDLTATLQKKEPDRARVAKLQKRTGEMLSAIQGEFQVDKTLTDSLQGAAQEVLEAIQRPETVSPALVRDLRATAAALLESLGPLTPNEQAAVARFRNTLSKMVRALERRPRLDPAALAEYDRRLEDLAAAMQSSGATPERIAEFRHLAKGFATKLARIDREFLQGLVNPGVLPIYPSDGNHLNGTFHFCASMGMERKRILRSIANGCFQTLGTLADDQRAIEGSPRPLENVTLRSVDELKKAKLLPQIQWSRRRIDQTGCCPFFLHSAKPYESYTNHQLETDQMPAEFKCPFFEAGLGEVKSVYKVCKKDSVHKDTFDKRREPGS